jgi:hypothetical protein
VLLETWMQPCHVAALPGFAAIKSQAPPLVTELLPQDVVATEPVEYLHTSYDHNIKVTSMLDSVNRPTNL